MRFLKRVNERGTMTLPQEVREALQVGPGDIVEFDVVGIVRRNKTAKEPEHAARSTVHLGGDLQ